MLNLVMVTGIYAQKRDTSVYFYKLANWGEGFTSVIQVNSLNEADYFRVVYPSETFHHYIINEFYKNGKIKLMGTTIPGTDPVTLNTADVPYDGDVATYYQNGKKQSLAHFVNGAKNGDEYLFYPDGKVYCYMKNSPHKQWNSQFNSNQDVTKSLFLECYDKGGNMICQNGNGEWITYSSDYSHVIMHGPVKNGYKDGKWTGNTFRADSIKYAYIYKKGEIKESFGYDKSGLTYPFEQIHQRANCTKGDVFSFLQSIRNHLKLPRGEDQLNIDTMHICFIIEKNGAITDFHVLGDSLSPMVKAAFTRALKPGSLWTPGKYYGVPFRTRVVLPFYVYRATSTTVEKTYTTVIGQKDQVTTTTRNSKELFGNEKLIDF